jgi:glycosyltransferase 2 family protein
MSLSQKQKTKLKLVLITSLVVFVVTAMLAYKRTFFDWEQDLFFAVYHLPSVFLAPFWIITQFGSGLLLILISVYFLIGRNRSQLLGRRLLVNGAVTYVIIELAKNIIGRARPDLLLITIKQKGIFELHGFGFPSGHTAMATIISLTIMTYLPKKWRWLPWAWIPLVGLSRIYLGAHAPLDIIGGFVVGVSVYCVSKLLQKAPE